MPIRPPLLLVAFVLVASPRAHAQLSAAEMFVNIQAGVMAVGDEEPLHSDSFAEGPRNEDIFLKSGTIPFDLFVASGGQAQSEGQLVYLATNTSEILTTGDYSIHAFATSPDSAIASFDAIFAVDFEVAVQATFTIDGYVSTTRDLSSSEIAACQYNGVILAGDTRATPLPAGTYPFHVERTLYPGEVGSLQCAAAASGATADSATVTWHAAVEGLPEPGATLASLAGLGSVAVLTRRRPQRH